MTNTYNRLAALALMELPDGYNAKCEYNPAIESMVLEISKRMSNTITRANLVVTAVERDMSDRYIKERLIEPLRAMLEDEIKRMTEE